MTTVTYIDYTICIQNIYVCDLNSISNGCNGYLSTKSNPEEYFNLQMKYVIKFLLKKDLFNVSLRHLPISVESYSTHIINLVVTFAWFVYLSALILISSRTNQVCSIKNIPCPMSCFVQLCPLSCLF